MGRTSKRWMLTNERVCAGDHCYLGDVALPVAAVATRLGGQVISADDDFDALPVTHAIWRSP